VTWLVWIDPVTETTTKLIVSLYVPLAPAKRPVPPVIVSVSVALALVRVNVPFPAGAQVPGQRHPRVALDDAGQRVRAGLAVGEHDAGQLAADGDRLPRSRPGPLLAAPGQTARSTGCSATWRGRGGRRRGATAGTNAFNAALRRPATRAFRSRRSRVRSTHHRRHEPRQRPGPYPGEAMLWAAGLRPAPQVPAEAPIVRLFRGPN
jgi:hypothetical protein